MTNNRRPTKILFLRIFLGLLVCSLCALGVHHAVSTVAHKVADRWYDETQLTALVNDRHEMEDLLHDAASKQPLAPRQPLSELSRLRRRMNLELEEVLRDQDQATRKSVHAGYAEFLAEASKPTSRRPLAPNSSGRVRFDGQLVELRQRSERQVRRWVTQANEAGISALLFVLFLVSLLAWQYRRHVNRSATVELTRRTAEAGQRRFRSLIQNNSDVIVVTTADGKIKLASDACIGAWGKTPDEVLGKAIFRLVDKECAANTRGRFEEMSATDVTGGVVEVRMPDGEGVVRDYEVRIVNLMQDPDIAGVLWTFHEVTERKRFEAALTRQAFQDVLTSLPNRALFLDRLTHRIAARRRVCDGFAVLFIDLDNFKVVNDSLGHAAGDQLILTIASRLLAVVRPTDTVARLGGDEFTVLLNDSRTADYAANIARRIIDSVAEPVILADRAVHVGASIGIAMSAESGNDAFTMLRDADTAMYRAKAQGKNGFTLFHHDMNVDAINRLEIESDLREAIVTGKLMLEYQPIVEVATGRIVEVEALVRWNHPLRGVIPPLDFINVAEETGLICELGDWALIQACSQLARWRTESRACRGLRMNVNVSARQLQDPHFVARVRDVLQRAEVDPALVGLEITETSMLRDLSHIREAFKELRSIGVRLVIDDFGTGYSSLSHVSNLPIDTLKIDRSFIEPLRQAGANRGVVQAMITLARSLGLEVTTEGIENGEQLEALREMGCDKAQGFHFAPGVSPEAIVNLVAISENIPPAHTARVPQLSLAPQT